MRKALAAKQHQPEIVENFVDIFANKDTHALLLRFRKATDNFIFSEVQAKEHILALIKAAKEAGIHVKQDLMWAE
jgi:hypothetical protein